MPPIAPCVPCGSSSQSVDVPGPSGLNAWAVVTASFVVPNPNQNVTVQVNQTAGFALGQNVYAASGTATGANFTVYSVNNPTSLTLTALGFSGDVASGSTIPVNSLLTPGPGNVPSLSTVGFTTTTAGFTLGTPFSNTVTVNVVSTAAFAVGQNIFISDGTNRVNALITNLNASAKTLTVAPIGITGDLLSGTVNSGALVMPGTGNMGSYGTATTTTATAAVPASTAPNTFIVSVANLDVLGAGVAPQFVIIYSPPGSTALYGTFQVKAAGATSLTLLPLYLPNDNAGGNTLPIGSIVLPCGNISATGFGPGIAGDPIGTQMAVYLIAAAGSGYALNTAGGGSPTANGVVVISAANCQIVLPLAGTYLIFGRALINYTKSTDTGVSFPVTGSGLSHVVLKLRDITDGNDFAGSISTFIPRTGASTGIVTSSGTAQDVPLSPVTLVVTSPSKTIQLWAVIDTSPTAGVVEITEASIVAVKIA